MSRGLTLLLAVAAGAAVGDLYWSQPLLDFIAGDLRSATTTAGWLVRPPSWGTPSASCWSSSWGTW